MQYTVGYTATGSLPIQIAYNCSKCGYLNIQKCVLHEEIFNFTEAGANASVSAALNSRIKAIQESKDAYALQAAEIEGKCRRCKYVEHWSKKEGISSWGRIRLVLFIILASFLGVTIFQTYSENSEPSSSLSPQAQTLLGIVVPIALVVIVLIVIIVMLAKENKKETVSKEALPIIISVGDKRGNSREETLFRKISLFMDIDKEGFIKRIHKCKDAKRIRKKVEDMRQMYSILFDDDFISALDELTTKEELEQNNQKDAALSVVETHLSALEEEAPLVYLDYLAHNR